MRFEIAQHSLKHGKWLYRQAWRISESAIREDYRKLQFHDADGFPTLYLVGLSAQGFMLVDDYPNGDFAFDARDHRPSMAELVDDLTADDWVVCEPL